MAAAAILNIKIEAYFNMFRPIITNFSVKLSRFMQVYTLNTFVMYVKQNNHPNSKIKS